MRLALLAAAEAERAEVETNFAYAWEKDVLSGCSGGGRDSVMLPQCAVCYSPTTTRCSRCKAVRYCSGKCQIIHWRQGHKDGCRPPEVGSRCISQERIPDLKEIHGERSGLFSSNMETGGDPYAGPFKSFPKRPASSESNCSSEDFSEDGNLENRFLFDTSGTDSTSESSTVSSPSSCSTFSYPSETNEDDSANEDSLHHNLTSDNSPQNLLKSVSREVEPSKLPVSEVGNANLPVTSVSCLRNLNQKMTAVKTEVECVSISPFHVGNTSPSTPTCTKPPRIPVKCQNASPDSRAPQNGGSDTSTVAQTYQQDDQICSRVGHSSSEASPLERMALMKSRDVVALNVDRPVCASSGRLLKSERFISSSSASDDHISSGTGDKSVAKCASLKISTAPTYPMRMSQRTDSVKNDGNDLKTSARGVVQKSKSSTYSRHQPSRLGSYSGKYSSKMPSPYDLFINLYNCDKVELRPCGLTNCGNSCYANAVLQCLAFTRPLTAYILQGLHSKACLKKNWCFTCEFESLLLKAKQGKSPLSPIGIISHIHDIGSNLGNGKEEDAHEFLRYAIDAMEYVCLKEAGTNAVDHLTMESTLVQLTFGGYLQSKIKCMRCKGKSERQERMMDLTVEIHGDIGTLEEALVRFTATEILDGNNKYQCNRCKSYEPAKKKLTILEAPNVLTIALKRFQSGKFGKINKTVRFPEYLNLAPYMRGTDDKSPVYRLYAVVVHLDIMNASFSGHYVSYVKDTQGKWYKIDDSKVKPVELEKVLKQGAYMLFYARCSPRSPSLLKKAVHDNGNMKNMRVDEADSHISKSRSSMFSRYGSSAAEQRNQEYPYRATDGYANLKTFDLFSDRYGPPNTDSSSDNSSLLSCSDFGSSSTDSTRGSTGVEDLSEYLFGELDRMSWNSPQRFSADSDISACSPLRPKHLSEVVSNARFY